MILYALKRWNREQTGRRLPGAGLSVCVAAQRATPSLPAADKLRGKLRYWNSECTDHAWSPHRLRGRGTLRPYKALRTASAVRRLLGRGMPYPEISGGSQLLLHSRISV